MNEITNSTEWNALVLKAPPKSGAFLHSWEWGEFQRAVGRTVLREDSLSLDGRGQGEGDEWMRAQIIEQPLPFGNKYWYLPRASLIDGLVEKAHKRGVLFIRFEPEKTPGPPAIKTTHVSPPTTLILDLSKSEDELLSSMHEKTRYNIRLALRKGVRIEPRTQNLEPSCFEIFWKLLEETARRDGFRTHPRSYYKNMIETLKQLPPLSPPTRGRGNSSPLMGEDTGEGAKLCFAKLWTAEWEGKPLAAGIWIYFGDTVTYLHGASASEHREVMAPYALHWEVMCDAKSRGYHYYDFWGVNPTSYKLQATSLWKGITRFKMGFGGETVSYPGTYDLPISRAWYTLYWIVRGLRRILPLPLLP